MKEALDPILIGIETFALILIIGILFYVSTKFIRYEKLINSEVEHKSRTSETVTDYTADESIIYISGASVITEILSYNDGILVYVDGTLLNNERIPTGESFYEYIRNHGSDFLSRYVVLSNNYSYTKNEIIDSEGNLLGVEYRLKSGAVAHE